MLTAKDAYLRYSYHTTLSRVDPTGNSSLEEQVESTNGVTFRRLECLP